MANRLEGLVAEALTNVRNPRLEKDVISAGMVQDIVVESDGRISLTFLLGREDPAGLVREVRRALQQVEGVTDLKIDVEEPTRVSTTSKLHDPSPVGCVPVFWSRQAPARQVFIA